MNRIKKHIPNTLTILNLLCGCVGIVVCLEGYPIPTAFFVWAACGFDFFDGFAARLINVSSSIGKELDSLADVISFGMLPSVMFYIELSRQSDSTLLPWLAFSIVVFSALRLAKFNVDEKQTNTFIGLPTPANALFLTGLPLLPESVWVFIKQPMLLSVIILIFSYLLVARLELFALKFKNFSWADNKIRFLFLFFSILLLAVLHQSAIPVIILLYILISFIQALSTNAGD